MFLKPSNYINYYIYPGSSGAYFSILNDEIKTVRGCRVETSWDILNNRGVKQIGFAAPNINLDLVRAFWAQACKNLSKNSIPVFKKTNLNNCIIVEIPVLWRQNSTSRSLFTLLLRCSIVYYDKDFKNSILKYKLAAKVIHAIEWFLAGNTKPTYCSLTKKYEGYTGFVAQFHDVKDEDLGRWLNKF